MGRGIKCATKGDWENCAPPRVKSVGSFSVAEISHNVQITKHTRNAISTGDHPYAARKNNEEGKIASMSCENAEQNERKEGERNGVGKGIKCAT